MYYIVKFVKTWTPTLTLLAPESPFTACLNKMSVNSLIRVDVDDGCS